MKVFRIFAFGITVIASTISGCTSGIEKDPEIIAKNVAQFDMITKNGVLTSSELITDGIAGQTKISYIQYNNKSYECAYRWWPKEVKICTIALGAGELPECNSWACRNIGKNKEVALPEPDIKAESDL